MEEIMARDFSLRELPSSLFWEHRMTDEFQKFVEENILLHLKLTAPLKYFALSP
jgi:hypothetical protein